MKHLRRKAFRLSLILLWATLMILLLSACTAKSKEDTTPAGTSAVSELVTNAFSDGETQAPDGESSAEGTETTTEEVTEEPTTRINVPTDPAHITFYAPQKPRLNTIFTGSNQCKVEIAMDPTYGSVLKLTTTNGATDPFVTFHFATYVKSQQLESIRADDYKYIVLTLRAENCTSETFELFYCAGSIQEATPGYQSTASFNISDSGWQKIIFDLSNADWSGKINAFRLDFLTAPEGEGEIVYIYAMDFYQTAEEAYSGIDIDLNRPGEGSDLTEKPVDGVNYDQLTAPDEDASVKLWFDHMTEKLYQSDTTSSGLNTYVIHMAGNSIENCQFFLTPTSDRSFTVSLSDFADGKGNILKTRVLREQYVLIGDRMVPDALPPLEGAVTVKGGNSQGFVIKVWAEANQPAGLYTATLNVTDANSGKVIKTAKVYTYVYGFSLSEETALKSAVGLGDWSIYNSYQKKGMEDKSYEELYKIYYDFLLENRLAAYRLPYSLNDERVVEYLNNPRVTSFVINRISDNEEQAYSILKDNPDWLSKGFYYYVDEPTNTDLLNELANNGTRLSSTFPGYRQISPFFTNIAVGEEDQIEFMKPYMNIWCTKVSAFTPRDKFRIPGTQYMTTSAQDKKYGTFSRRMDALQKEGHELWLYFCWEPGQPYANWLALGDGTEPVVSLWQCKMTNATGILYWASTWWTDDPLHNLTPLVGAASHGDGVLLYSGAEVGSYEPISSHRLENVRNGIQDYQLLTMLESAVGEEKVDGLVAMVTEDVITYTCDDDYLKAVRVLLFEQVAASIRS